MCMEWKVKGIIPHMHRNTNVHDDDTTKINTNDIFDSNPTNLKTTAKKQLTKILEKLKN